jgi:XTP/dITP diphosphohydrolase
LGQVKERGARFVCAVALSSPDQKQLRMAHGICCGRIGLVPKGNSGFGYDPLFVPNGFDKTFAELEESVKNEISHRGRALRKARRFLVDLLEQD